MNKNALTITTARRPLDAVSCKVTLQIPFPIKISLMVFKAHHVAAMDMEHSALRARFGCRRDGEPYREFIIRAAKNNLGRRVKLADLNDNQNLGRIPFPTEKDRTRANKYRNAIILINSIP